MGQLWFTYVPVEGFVSFSQVLDEEAWGAIDPSPWEGPKQTALKPLGDAPAVVVWKLQIAWVIGALLAARDGAGSAKDRDKAWDNGQRSLSALLTAAAASSDAKKREAAGRLQKSLLKGRGEAQTKLKYQQEVDFGRQQNKLVSEGQAAADIVLLNLQPAMEEIAATTEALAVAIGHGDGSERPGERLKAAMTACASTFSAVAQQLAWLIDNGEAGADQQRAAELRTPLEKLADRYPGPAQQTTTAAPPQATAAEPTAPATTTGEGTAEP